MSDSDLLTVLSVMLDCHALELSSALRFTVASRIVLFASVELYAWLKLIMHRIALELPRVLPYNRVVLVVLCSRRLSAVVVLSAVVELILLAIDVVFVILEFSLTEAFIRLRVRFVDNCVELSVIDVTILDTVIVLLLAVEFSRVDDVILPWSMVLFWTELFSRVARLMLASVRLVRIKVALAVELVFTLLA